MTIVQCDQCGKEIDRLPNGGFATPPVKVQRHQDASAFVFCCNGCAIAWLQRPGS